MLVVEGFYENGKVELLQQLNTLNKQKVLITFIENEEDEQRILSLHQSTDELHSYLKDEAEDLYQDYLKK